MNRDFVLAALILVLCGAAVALSGLIPIAGAAVRDQRGSGRGLERRAWVHLWLPALPAALAFATLIGWRLQEPDVTDELMRPEGLLLALPFGFIWLRALIRAVLALRRPRAMPLVATFGLIRPRIAIDDRLHAVLDGDALAAARAHEQAHARHRDPLRLWLAQIVTDAQWPSPMARLRLDRWRSALEIARDEEARLAGAEGSDLAAAIVAVAGLSATGSGTSPPALACLTRAEAALATRVRRLLHPMPADAPAGTRLATLAVVLGLGAGVLIGIQVGDALLRALPFVTT